MTKLILSACLCVTQLVRVPFAWTGSMLSGVYETKGQTTKGSHARCCESRTGEASFWAVSAGVT